MSSTLKSKTGTDSIQGYVGFEEYIHHQLHQARRGIRGADLLTGGVGVALLTAAYLFLFVITDHWLVDGGWGTGARFFWWSLFILTASGWMWGKVFRPWTQRITSLYAASQLEQSHPDLKNNLLTLVDLQQAGRPISPAIIEAMERRAALNLQHFNVDDAIDRRLLTKMSYALLAMVVLICVYTLASPKSLMASAWRAMFPMASNTPVTQTTILDVTPGTLTVFAHATPDIEATLAGTIPDVVRVLYTTEDRSLVDEPIQLQETGEGIHRFRGRLTGERGGGLVQSGTYRVQAGDAVSPIYSVTVRQPPTATVEEVFYDYPQYMGLDDRLQAEPSVDAWEGTTVRVRALANVPVDQALVLFSDSNEITAAKAEEIPMQITDGVNLTAQWQLRFRTDGTFPRFYRIKLVKRSDVGEEAVIVPTFHSHRVREDLPPKLALLHPTADMQQPTNAKIPIAYEASDPDFLLKSVIMKFEKDGEVLPRQHLLFDAPPFESKTRGQYVLSLDSFDLEPGKSVTFWLEARDNFEPFADQPLNITRSSRITITAMEPANPEQVQADLADQKQAADQALDSAQQADSTTEPASQDDSNTDSTRQDETSPEPSPPDDTSPSSDPLQDDQSTESMPTEDDTENGGSPTEKGASPETSTQEQHGNPGSTEDSNSNAGTAETEAEHQPLENENAAGENTTPRDEQNSSSTSPGKSTSGGQHQGSKVKSTQNQGKSAETTPRSTPENSDGNAGGTSSTSGSTTPQSKPRSQPQTGNNPPGDGTSQKPGRPGESASGQPPSKQRLDKAAPDEALEKLIKRQQRNRTQSQNLAQKGSQAGNSQAESGHAEDKNKDKDKESDQTSRQPQHDSGPAKSQPQTANQSSSDKNTRSDHSRSTSPAASGDEAEADPQAGSSGKSKPESPTEKTSPTANSKSSKSDVTANEKSNAGKRSSGEASSPDMNSQPTEKISSTENPHQPSPPNDRPVNQRPDGSSGPADPNHKTKAGRGQQSDLPQEGDPKMAPRGATTPDEDYQTESGPANATERNRPEENSNSSSPESDDPAQAPMTEPVTRPMQGEGHEAPQTEGQPSSRQHPADTPSPSTPSPNNKENASPASSPEQQPNTLPMKESGPPTKQQGNPGESPMNDSPTATPDGSEEVGNQEDSQAPKKTNGQTPADNQSSKMHDNDNASQHPSPTSDTPESNTPDNDAANNDADKTTPDEPADQNRQPGRQMKGSRSDSKEPHQKSKDSQGQSGQPTAQTETGAETDQQTSKTPPASGEHQSPDTEAQSDSSGRADHNSDQTPPNQSPQRKSPEGSNPRSQKSTSQKPSQGKNPSDSPRSPSRTNDRPGGSPSESGGSSEPGSGMSGQSDSAGQPGEGESSGASPSSKGSQSPSGGKGRQPQSSNTSGTPSAGGDPSEPAAADGSAMEEPMSGATDSIEPQRTEESVSNGEAGSTETAQKQTGAATGQKQRLTPQDNPQKTTPNSPEGPPGQEPSTESMPDSGSGSDGNPGGGASGQPDDSAQTEDSGSSPTTSPEQPGKTPASRPGKQQGGPQQGASNSPPQKQAGSQEGGGAGAGAAGGDGEPGGGPPPSTASSGQGATGPGAVNGGLQGGSNPEDTQMSEAPEGPGHGGETANAENRKRAAALALQQLKDELSRGESPEEFLKELGWEDDDLDAFMKQLDENLNSADDATSPEAQARRRQFDELLKGVELNAAGELKSGNDQPRTASQSSGSNRRATPRKYESAEEAFRRRMQKGK